jgi:hypothetical protein
MMRGGGGAAVAAASQRTPTSLANGGGGEAIGQDLNLTTSKVLASLWGTSGVAYILLKAIKRVVPIALEPFKGEGVVPLTQFQLAWVLFCLSGLVLILDDMDPSIESGSTWGYWWTSTVFMHHLPNSYLNSFHLCIFLHKQTANHWSFTNKQYDTTTITIGSAYIITCLWFAYVEGYKGFQRKFSPLVVSRSFTLQSTSPFHHLLFAPFYSMGLFHATKKRMIVSWSVSIGVAAIVAAVKRLPYPWRNIVDAGVVIGLSWGTISIIGGYVISLVTGIAPIDVDPSLPESKE